MSDIVERLRASVEYSRNFATAKPDIGTTEFEHIAGLCSMLTKAVAELERERARADALQARLDGTVPAAAPPRCIWPDCGHDTNRVSDGGGCFGIGCPKPDTGQAAPVAQGVPEGIRAKPLVWEEGVPNRDGTICEWMAGMGFYVQLQPDEEPHLRYEANWGDIDTSSFPTLDEAKAWCQDEADAWVREWAMLSAAPQPPAAEGEI